MNVIEDDSNFDVVDDDIFDADFAPKITNLQGKMVCIIYYSILGL